MDPTFDGILSSDQIRTLLAVSDQGSFHRAAAALGVQQSAVNQLVKRLEAKLGRRLFDRTHAGVALTHDGEAVLVYARAMADLGANVIRHFRQADAETPLRIGIGEEFSRTSLPGVLGMFSRYHRSIRFESTCVTPSAGLFDLLDAERLDVVVARQDPDRRPGEPVWTEPTMWTGRHDLALTAAAVVPLVLPGAGALRDSMLNGLAAASRPWRVAFEGGSLSMLEAAVRAGLGVSACTARVKLVDCVVLDDAACLPVLPPSVFVLERRPSARSATIDAFCDVLKTAASLSLAPVDASHSGA